MKNSYSKRIAMNIAMDFQYLIGRPFTAPYTACNIDSVEPEQLDDGTYRVVVKHDAFQSGSIPEFFGFANPTEDLFTYMKKKDIRYN